MVRFVTQEPFQPFGCHTQRADLAAVQVLTPPGKGEGGELTCLMQCLDQNVRFTLDDQTTPTAAIGFVLRVTDPPLSVRTTKPIRVIEEAQGATLIYQWGL
jgi:hypothetical protein